MKVVAVILTLNEERQLARCIESLRGVVDQIWVVDSGSTDRTLEIAKDHGAHVLHHDFINYATQYNWALNQLPDTTQWVLRIDADEYLTPELRSNLLARLPTLSDEVVAVSFGRRMAFMGKMIRHGGVFPVEVVRLFRRGRGRCENRWMDEHIIVDGPTVHVAGELIDDNLKPLSWWIDKHNHYASREAVDLLNLEYGFMPRDSVAQARGGSQAGFKRWLKEAVYSRMPGGLRAFVYFFYRYVVRLGFLDGREGGAFHILQGFWYRYLVDAKVAEVKRHLGQQGGDIKSAISAVLGIKVS